MTIQALLPSSLHFQPTYLPTRSINHLHEPPSMGVDLNIFRLLGDLSHTASKLTLITAIHRNHSAEGVSLLTQMLYFLVFITRYLDLFWTSPLFSMWNFVLKIFYISSSVYVVWIMMRWFPRTREKEKAWKITTGSLGGSLVGAPVVTLVFRGWSGTSMGEVGLSRSAGAVGYD